MNCFEFFEKKVSVLERKVWASIPIPKLDLGFGHTLSLPVATASLASTAEFRIEFLVIKVSKLSIIHLGLFSFCKGRMHGKHGRRLVY